MLTYVNLRKKENKVSTENKTSWENLGRFAEFMWECNYEYKLSIEEIDGMAKCEIKAKSKSSYGSTGWWTLALFKRPTHGFDPLSDLINESYEEAEQSFSLLRDRQRYYTGCFD